MKGNPEAIAFEACLISVTCKAHYKRVDHVQGTLQHSKYTIPPALGKD